MNRPAWVDVALFSVSERPVWMILIAAFVTLVWWNLADFYVVQRLPEWPEWMESIIVLGLSVFLAALLVIITGSQIRKGLREFASPAKGFSPPRDQDTRRAMLSVVAENCQGLAHQYVSWLRDTARSWKPWLSVSWVFALLLFLASPPLHSDVMELVSRYMRTTPGSLIGVPADDSRAPDEIFNVRNAVTKTVMEQNSAVEKTFETRLKPVGDKWEREVGSIVDAIGGETTKLLFYSGDFPHLHRSIDVECVPPGCVPRGLPSRRAVRVPVRAGVAVFAYLQPHDTAIQGVPLLGVRASLRKFSGRRLFSVLVEHRE